MLTEKLLIIIQQTAHAGEDSISQQFKETMDAALAMATFGVKVSLWFCDKGVNYLKYSEQFKILQALEYYDIDNVLVTQNDADIFKLSKHNSNIDFSIIDSKQLASVFEQNRTILRMN